MTLLLTPRLLLLLLRRRRLGQRPPAIRLAKEMVRARPRGTLLLTHRPLRRRRLLLLRRLGQSRPAIRLAKEKVRRPQGQAT
jgi:hypothetical protein